MKRIKDILTALKTLRRVPSTSIQSAWGTIKTAMGSIDYSNSEHGVAIAISESINLLDTIVSAVVAIAKDEEDKAAAPGKDGK